MARTVPDDRLARLVECATQVFIEQGYRRTQMADVAREMGSFGWPSSSPARSGTASARIAKYLERISEPLPSSAL